MLPIRSTETVQPASLHQRTKRSRPWRSRSVSASRQTPPLSVAPILAISIRLCHRRSPLTRRFLPVVVSLMTLLEWFQLLGGLPQRVVGMLEPGERLPPGRDLDHADTACHRASIHAEIAADTLLVDHLVAPLAVGLEGGDRLVRGIFAGDMAEAALDAGVLVDAGHDLVVEIEMLPVGHVGQRAADDGVEPIVAPRVEPVAEAVHHVVDDLEAVMHG